MARLIAFGDSFTFGNDLHDWNEHTHTSSLSTWPALLAKSLMLDYVCVAEPGSSNSSIARQVLSFDFDQTDVVILNWTWINRWDFFNGTDWETLRPSGTEKSIFARYYYKFFQSEEWDKFETLKHIQLIHGILEQKNIKYISTAIDELVIDSRWHCPEYINALMNLVSRKLQWFDNRGFYHWARENKFKISALKHPLEDAHQAAFEYIIQNQWHLKF